jgi:GNAT superfamily N-acetyltransferase
MTKLDEEISLKSDTRAGFGTVLLRTLWTERPKGLRVEWPDYALDRETIEDALHELPESCDWPGLFDVLLEPRGAEKQVALVLDREGPMAVVLLRATGPSSWEPATQWIVPGFLFPVRPGCTWLALETLRLSVRVGWWRYPEPPPSGPRIQNFRESLCCRMICTTDFDDYWKRSGNLSMVRQAQRRCKNFVLRADPEGGAEWTIRRWEEKWRSDPKVPMPAVEDRVAAAKFLEKSGKQHTFVLFDGDRPIAGVTFLAHSDSAVGQVMYRDPEYDRCGVGTYTMEAFFRWALRSGYKEIDMGGGHGYKQLWAPSSGYIYEFTVSPAETLLKRMAKRLAA